MCVMLDSIAPTAAPESTQFEFSHGLQEFRTSPSGLDCAKVRCEKRGDLRGIRMQFFQITPYSLSLVPGERHLSRFVAIG
jgi:hypothetical protein